MMSTMDFALTAIPREFPQFGKSVWNAARHASEVWGREDCCASGSSGHRFGGAGGRGCGCEGCQERPGGAGNVTLPLDPTPFGSSDAEVPLGPLLPNDPYETIVEVHEKLCGPDVTDYVVDTLMDMLRSTDPAYNVASVRGLGPIDLRSEVKGLPNRPVAKTDKCPRNCSESLALCGKCISDQIPGNMALGLKFGKDDAEVIGAGAAWFKGETDSADDVRSYRVGADVRAAVQDYIQVQTVVQAWAWFAWSSIVVTFKKGAREKLSEAICKGVHEGIKDGVFEDKKKSQNCDPCPDGPWPPKKKK